MNELHFATLAENREWLRRLAGRLAGDPELADDAVQQTLAIGMERGPNEPSKLRAWLKAVLRNEIRGAYRRNRRREAREGRVARRDRTSDGDALVERLELQKRVTEAVLTLDEPFRKIVLMRYVDEKSPSDIARELDLPAATVRTRLHRAHDRLRAKLDDEYGERGRWQPAMLALGVPTLGTTSATLATIGGVLTVKKFAIAASIVALIVCGIQFGPDLLRGGASDTSSPVVTDLDRGAESEASTGEVGGTDDAVDSVSGSPDGSPFGLGVGANPEPPKDAEEDAESESIPSDVAIVHGHIECSDGRSFEGDRIYLWGGGQPSAIIDADNNFEIECPFSFSTWIMLESNGVGTGVRADVRPLLGRRSRVDIFVELGHELDIAVVEEGSGRPVAYQKMVLRRSASDGQASSSWAESDAHGRVRFAYLPEADYVLEIMPDDYTYYAETLRVPTDGEYVAELAAPRELVVLLKNYSEHPPQEQVHAQFFALEREGQAKAVGNRIEKAIPEPSGRLVMRAPPPGKWMYDFFGMSDFPRKGGRIEIPESGPIPELVLELPSACTTLVTGVLRTPGENVVSKGSLTIGQVDATFRDDGSFEADRVKPGSQDVWFDESQYRRYMLDPIEVPTSSAMHGVELELPGDDVLRITVEGMPQHLIGQEVEFRIRAEGTSAEVAWGFETVQDTVQFSYFAPGRYTLFLARKGWCPSFWRGTIEVEAGVQNELTIQHPGVVACPFEIEVPDGVEPPTSVRIENDVREWIHGRISMEAEVAGTRGEFEVARIGEIRARMVANGFEPVPITFDAPTGDGEPEVVRVRLKPTKQE